MCDISGIACDVTCLDVTKTVFALDETYMADDMKKQEYAAKHVHHTLLQAPATPYLALTECIASSACSWRVHSSFRKQTFIFGLRLRYTLSIFQESDVVGPYPEIFLDDCQDFVTGKTNLGSAFVSLHRADVDAMHSDRRVSAAVWL
eukprot:2364279-Rhodomonas_salina.2